MRTTLRLTFKQYRFEIVAVALACLLLGAGALIVAWRMNQVGIPTGCLYGASGNAVTLAPGPDDPHERACQPLRDEFYGLDNRFAARAMALMAPLPLLAGLLLGVPLVGRELEQGTASLAWTLGRSRRRWFLARVLPLSVLLALLLLLPAVAGEVLERARQPFVDPGASFADYGLRGGLLVARGMLAFALGVVAGAVIGRQLPALIVGGALLVGSLVAVGTGIGSWMPILATWQLQDAPTAAAGGLFYDQGARNRVTGQVIPADQAVVAGPADPSTGTPTTIIDPRYELVTLTLPGSRYALVETVEGALTGAAAALVLLTGLLVVDRRRPG